MMYKVKLSINAPKEGLLRQTPNLSGIWENYKFYINQGIEECDFWVVYSKGRKKNETAKVAPDNLIFISGEPEPVYHYDSRFLKQFSTIITSRRDIKHPNIIYQHPAQPWHVGRISQGGGKFSFVKDYDYFKHNDSFAKEELISVVSSNRAFTKGHNDRTSFVRQLKECFGDQLAVFGRGINEVGDKWEAIARYKYHVAIENSSFPDYWTEKLADSYLAGAFPFYYGCKNIDKYFSAGSYIPIDIYDVDKAIKIVEKAIAEDVFENSADLLKEAKRRVLDEYNIFALIASVCDGLDALAPKETVNLHHELSYFDPSKIPMMIKRMYYKILYR